MKVLRDTGVLFGRSMRHILRSPDTIITVYNYADHDYAAVRLCVRRRYTGGNR